MEAPQLFVIVGLVESIVIIVYFCSRLEMVVQNIVDLIATQTEAISTPQRKERLCSVEAYPGFSLQYP